MGRGLGCLLAIRLIDYAKAISRMSCGMTLQTTSERSDKSGSPHMLCSRYKDREVQNHVVRTECRVVHAEFSSHRRDRDPGNVA